ncbi:hypothetical protein LIQ25_15090 [Blautia glucerasea]|uniref:hypothetical protein n=1 Tax=Blautia glucerasea TaxID=536633 RepID=UPI001D00D2C5|nr:hypothetical protein [Blautia glucerasea]MCB5383762.1 hypothetical protein [Blautia glucerasea]
MKDLKDLNLLDRFLFAEAMEDPQNMRDVLEIILGKDVVLKHLPQTEKEARISPAYRFALRVEGHEHSIHFAPGIGGKAA